MGTVILCTAESLIQPIYAALICIYIYASLPIHAMREYLTIKHILASPQRSPTPTCDSPPRARYTTRGAVNESHTDHRAPFPPHRGSRHSCWGQELYHVSLLLLHSLPEIGGYQGRRIMLPTDAILAQPPCAVESIHTLPPAFPPLRTGANQSQGYWDPSLFEAP